MHVWFWFVRVVLQRGGDCIQANGGANNQTPSSSNNDSLTMTEHQVAKLMEEDMGSAMQYLQGKGLCLMPISLATAISTATCHSRNPLIPNNINNNSNNNHRHHHPVAVSDGVEGPSSPSMSVLTVQSATLGNGGTDSSVKDAASVSKPWWRHGVCSLSLWNRLSRQKDRESKNRNDAHFVFKKEVVV